MFYLVNNMNYIKLYENIDFESIVYEDPFIDLEFSKEEISKIRSIIKSLNGKFFSFEKRIGFEIFFKKKPYYIRFLIIKVPDDYYHLCVDYLFKYKCDQIGGLKKCIIHNIKEYKDCHFFKENKIEYLEDSFSFSELEYEGDNEYTQNEVNILRKTINNIFDIDETTINPKLDNPSAIYFDINNHNSLFHNSKRIFILKKPDDYYYVIFDFNFKYKCDQLTGVKKCLKLLSNLTYKSSGNDFKKINII